MKLYEEAKNEYLENLEESKVELRRKLWSTVYREYQKMLADKENHFLITEDLSKHSDYKDYSYEEIQNVLLDIFKVEDIPYMNLKKYLKYRNTIIVFNPEIDIYDFEEEKRKVIYQSKWFNQLTIRFFIFYIFFVIIPIAIILYIFIINAINK